MNSLQQSILSLYNYDEDPRQRGPVPDIVKGISILAKLPSMAAYAYQSKIHYYDRESLDYPLSEGRNTPLRRTSSTCCAATAPSPSREADLLDIMLMIHADHGGGNNSTFYKCRHLLHRNRHLLLDPPRPSAP